MNFVWIHALEVMTSVNTPVNNKENANWNRVSCMESPCGASSLPSGLVDEGKLREKPPGKTLAGGREGG